MRRRYLLRCRDPLTHRSSERLIAHSFIEREDPDLLARLIIELVASIGVNWRYDYGVNFPRDRAEWDIRVITEAATL